MNQRESFILHQDVSLWALTLTRTIPTSSMPSNMDRRIFFATMPQGKTSNFPATQTRNHSKANRSTMLGFHLLPFYQGKHRLRSDPEEIRDWTVTPVALSWPLVSVHLTQLGWVSSRGECWNVLTELQLHPKSVFSKENKGITLVQKRWFGFT